MRILLLTLGVALLAMAAGSPPPGEAAPAPPASPFDVPEQVVVIGYGSRYAITYDRKVSPAQAAKDLHELATRAGWTPTGAQVTTERGPLSSAPLTSVDFTAEPPDSRTHTFPLAPIVVTFRRFSRVGAVFMVPPGYPYWGPLAYETPQVAMKAEVVGGSYTFHFLIKDPAVSEFQVPLASPSAPRTVPAPTVPRSDLWLRVGLVAALALGAAGIVYGIASLLADRGAKERV